MEKLCSCCKERVINTREELELCLMEETELEYGSSHAIEDLEELRLLLRSFLRKELLDSILYLYKELSREPCESEMYSWFVRNSQVGGECRYAIAALKRFKENRLDKIEPLLLKCLESIKELKDSSS